MNKHLTIDRDQKSQMKQKVAHSPISKSQTNCPLAPFLFKQSKMLKEVSFKEHDNQIDQTMKRYQTTNKNLFIDEEDDDPYKYLTKDDERFIQKTIDLNKSFFTNKNTEDFKVSIQQVDYANPFQSLKIIRKNKDVFTDVTEAYLQRQKARFTKSIKAYNALINKKTKILPIRVIKTEPKVDFIIPVIDKTDIKKKKDTLSGVIVNNQLRLFAYYRYSNKNCPEGREQFSLTLNKSKVILFGGLSSIQKSNMIWSMDVDTLEWSKIIPNNTSYSRFGHTTICYQDRLYIFGGRSKMPNGSVMASIDLFSFQDNNWIFPVMAPKTTPTLRRNHVAKLIGSQILFHGGLSESGEYLNDCAVLNISPLKWLLCHVDSAKQSPYLYGHSVALVVPSHYITNPRMSIYKFPDNVGLTVMDLRIKEKGLYFFGGKQKEKDELTNGLWILRLGQKPLEWVKQETKGLPPCPRYFHSMDYYEPGNYLIIHGGRNDSSDSSALNDTFIFNVEQSEWIEILLYSHLLDFKLFPRCGHSSLIYCKYIIYYYMFYS